MERPHGKIEQAQDEYDYELLQVQADAIALADALLAHRAEKSTWRFVDMVLEGSGDDMVAELQQGPFAHLLASPDEQLAFESDGSYYPILDVRKEKGRLVGVGLRVFGWEEEKWRRIDSGDAAPHGIKRYPGQKDRTGQFEIAMSYRVGEEAVTEILSLSFGTTSKRPYASSRLHMMAYAETGYEGHGGKGYSAVSDEDSHWLLDFIARHVGDNPKSVAEVQQERLEIIREDARRNGVLKSVDKLINGTWNAQALYLMNLPCRLLDGCSIAEGLKSPVMATRAASAAKIVLKQYKGIAYGTTDRNDWILGPGATANE